MSSEVEESQQFVFRALDVTLYTSLRSLDPGDFAISSNAREKCKVMLDSTPLKTQPSLTPGRLCVKPVGFSSTALWEATRNSPPTSAMDADCRSRLGATMMTALQVTTDVQPIGM